MNTITLDKAIEIGVQAGVKEAIDRIKLDEAEKWNYKKDKRLRNTDLLLRNYNSLMEHYKRAVYTTEKAEDINVNDLLDESRDEIYIEAIYKTRARTQIMIEHIDSVFGYYEYKARKDNDINAIRRYNVIKLLYFEKKKYLEVSQELNCSTKTVNRDRKLAIEELSTLFFGIDGIKL